MATDLLPPGSTPLEHAIARACAPMAEISVDIPSLWNPWKCPAPLLPWLAWALSVDTWDSVWPEQIKRSVIAESVAVHRIKGTPSSVKRALTAAGFPDATIVEGLGRAKYDGNARYNGLYFYGFEKAWACYHVLLDHPITLNQAKQVRLILEETAPARCELLKLDFTKVPNIYDGRSLFDGSYSYGVA